MPPLAVPSAVWPVMATSRSVFTCTRWRLLFEQSLSCLAAHYRTHYVPVLYEPELWPEGSNLHEAWGWVSQHPAEAAQIVDNARAFSQTHFTRLGQTCYVVRLLHEYSKLMSDRDQIPELLHYNRSSTPH